MSPAEVRRPGRIVLYLSLAVLFAVLALAGQGTAGFVVFLAGAVFFELRFWLELVRAMKRTARKRD